MTYRNLDRYFCFEKALVLYNKKEELSKRDLHVLLAVYHVGKIGVVTSGTIDKHLRRFFRTLSPNAIQESLQYLLREGFVSSAGCKPTIYSITMPGQLRLKELDERAKATRYDR